MTEFSEVAKKLRKTRHLADAPSLMSDLGYPYYLTRTGYRHLPPSAATRSLLVCPGPTPMRVPLAQRIGCLSGISRDEKRLPCAALLEGGIIIVWWAQTYSLGILEWSYGLDRPYIVHVLGGWEQFPFYTM